MRVLRLLPLIAVVTLTMCIFALIGRAHRETTVAAADPPTSTAQSQDPPQTCPITKPPTPPFVPPSPYPTQTSDGGFWFGTERLWTYLRKDGTWKGLPHYRPTDTAFRQKVFWFSGGWQIKAQPKLEVTGERLDASAPPSQAATSNGWTNDRQHPFMVTGMDIPTLGCWKIIGHYQRCRVEIRRLGHTVTIIPATFLKPRLVRSPLFPASARICLVFGN